MLRFDASSAECLVFTYKEGLLSAVAHDLKIRVGRFTVHIDPVSRAIEAHFDTGSLEVLCAMADGQERPRALTAADKRKIEHTATTDVLGSARYSEVQFVSSMVMPEGAGFRVEGNLSLHGQRRPVAFVTRAEGGHQVAEVKVHQPDFGIKPYSAMLGALKVKPDITVRVALSARDLPVA